MEPFSVELWVAIVRELGYAEWIILSRTCKFFCIIAQPELYRKVFFSTQPRSGGGDKKKNLKATCFSRSLTNKPELAGLVRSLTYQFDCVIPPSTNNNPILRRLSLFINLWDLSLDNCHIETEFSSALRSLSYLKSVRFDGCTVVPVSGESQDYPVSGKLLDVHISTPLSTNGWSATIPGHLQTLTIFRRKGPSMKTILLDLACGGRNNTLTEFKISGFIPPNIIVFLQSSHNIRRISIPRLRSPSRTIFHSLPEDCMPLLEHFSGPSELCGVFVKGRPVHSATLMVSDRTPNDILLSLRHSTVPIINLMLSFKKNHTPVDELRNTLLGTFLIHAPITLERLAWNYIRESYLISCLPLLSLLVNLRSLHGRVASCNFEKTVKACSKANASLHEMVFVAGGKRNRDIRWVKSNDGKWAHYTLKPSDRPSSRIHSFSL